LIKEGKSYSNCIFTG